MSESEMDATEILLSVHEDVGPFIPLGTEFKSNGVSWAGPTAASATAFYLLKKGRNASSYGGGLGGALLASAFAKDDGISTCLASDLPDPIRAILDRKRKLDSKNVVIIPKATVALVKGGGLAGTLTVLAGADKFIISTGLFSTSSKARKLGALGWALNTPLTPTAAPIHDTRNDTERAAPTGKPLWVKVLAVIGFIVLIGLVIALRIIADHR